MKFPLTAKIEKAASKDAARPTLNRLYLRITETKTGRGRNRRTHRQGWLEATDSYKLVRIPVELDEEDVEGFIPIEAVTRARKHRVVEIGAAVGVRVKDVVFDRPGDGTWPDLPKLVEADSSTFSIGLNARLLMELAEALGSDDLRLDFTGSLTPIKVLPLGGEAPQSVGLIMPIRLAGPPSPETPAALPSKKRARKPKAA